MLHQADLVLVVGGDISKQVPDGLQRVGCGRGRWVAGQQPGRARSRPGGISPIVVTVSFRPLERDDFPLLSWWLSRPHVQAWWPEEAASAPSSGATARRSTVHDATELFIVEVDGQAAGMVQRYRLEDNPDWEKSLAPSGSHEDAVGIDYLIGEESVRRHRRRARDDSAAWPPPPGSATRTSASSGRCPARQSPVMAGVGEGGL